MLNEDYGIEADLLGSTSVSDHDYIDEEMAGSLLNRHLIKSHPIGTAIFFMDHVNVSGRLSRLFDIPYNNIHRIYTFARKKNVLMLAMKSDTSGTHVYRSYQFYSHQDFLTVKGILVDNFFHPKPPNKIYSESSPRSNRWVSQTVEQRSPSLGRSHVGELRRLSVRSYYHSRDRPPPVTRSVRRHSSSPHKVFANNNAIGEVYIRGGRTSHRRLPERELLQPSSVIVHPRAYRTVRSNSASAFDDGLRDFYTVRHVPVRRYSSPSKYRYRTRMIDGGNEYIPKRVSHVMRPNIY